VSTRRHRDDQAMNEKDDGRPDVDNSIGSRLGRRSFLKLAAGGVALGAAGATGVVHFTKSGTSRQPVKLTATVTGRTLSWHMVATDGYAAMPDPRIVAPIGDYYPDLLAPVDYGDGSGQSMYIFGFADVTDIPGFAASNLSPPWDPDALVAPIDFKTQAQISAPLLYCDDGDDVRINLENLGLGVRPDLFDPHTIHWHGFANQIPYFDGVPDASLSVPSGSDLTYRYLPVDVGTYMYHCHVEDVEHVHMGLTGMIFIRTSKTALDGNGNNKFTVFGLDTSKKYAYYDVSTEYDREFAILLTEANVENHWNDGHIQESDWSEYRSTFGLMNGRAWPDTIQKNGSFFDRDAAGGAGQWRNNQMSGDVAKRLAYQPNSSLIQANAGEKVLLRISNLGFDEHSLVLPGIELTMVGRDSKFLGDGRPDYFPTGDPRQNIEVKTYRIDIGPGESRDLIFTAPAATGNPDVYPFYDRSILFLSKKASRGVAASTDGSDNLTADDVNSFTPADIGSTVNGAGATGQTIIAYIDTQTVQLSSAAAAGSGTVTITPPATDRDGYGAMRTEVHIYPSGLGPQTHPNQLF
jgi:FtsP/CotA-like multicopper oxidase with cupredoxin domain